MKRILTIISIGMLLILLIPAVVLAYTWHIDFTVTESGGNAYTSLPLYGLANNSYLATNGYISATGLNTRIYASDNSVLPHMLTEDRTYFVTPQPALNTQVVTYALGESALSSFDIIPGYSGNITTTDDASLELGIVFDISLSGYLDTSVGTDKNIIYKSGACKLNISAASTITFHALNADNSDNWTLVANPVGSGTHTMRIYADGKNAQLYIDGASVDTQNLLASTIDDVGDIGGSASVYFNHTGRYTFHHNGRYWVFYFVADGANSGDLWYRSSTDGDTWDAAIQVTATSANVTYDINFSTYFDGTYGYYVWSEKGNPPVTADIYFRRFTPNADGSITYSAAEQTAVADDADGSTDGQYPSLTILTDGRAMLTYCSHGTGSDQVILNSAVDGTWSTVAGYPLAVTDSHATGSVSNPQVIKLTGGDAYVLRTDSTLSGYDIEGRKFDSGTGWSVDETIKTSADSTHEYKQAAAIAADASDDIYILYYYEFSPFGLFMKVRDSSGSLSDEIIVKSGYEQGTWTCYPVYNPVSDSIFIFYTDGAKIYYKTYSNGVLGDEVIVVTESVGRMTSFEIMTNDKIGIATIDSAGELKYTRTVYPWTWGDNANDWLWMTNNSMSYADNITMAVSGTTKLLYKPDSIIVGTTLPDESGNGNDGTFSWGTNPTDVDVIPGPLASDVDTSEPGEGVSPWSLVPTVPAQPPGLFTDGGEGMLGLAELGDASEATDNPREMFGIMLAFLLAVILGFAVYGATHNARMGVKGSILLQSITSLVVMIFFYVGGGGVIPGWVLIPFGIEAFFIMLWRNPQHSST